MLDFIIFEALAKFLVIMSDMKRKTLLFISILCSLFSCSTGEIDGDSSISVTPLAYIDINADYESTTLSSYSEMLGLKAVSALSKADRKIPTLLLDSREGCGYCSKFEPICLGALKKTGFNIEIIYGDENDDDINSSYKENLLTLQNRYGVRRGEGGIDGSTPSLYLLNGERMELIDMYDDNGNVNKFSSFLNSLFIKTRISHFSCFSTFRSYYEAQSDKPLTLLIDEANEEAVSFYASFYDLAKLSENELYYVDVSRLSETDKNDFSSYFALEMATATLIDNETKLDCLNEKSEAMALVSSYYA